MQWDCPACGHANASALVCDACGVARRYHEDPPLDVPRRPRWAEVGATYAAAAYGILASGGVMLLLDERLRAWSGFGTEWIALEVALTATAAAGSLVQAFWTRAFHRSELVLPQAARAGHELEAVLELVPYEPLERVWVSFELVDRWYEREGFGSRRRVRTRSRVLERWTLHEGGSLTGRRRHEFRVTFAAPPPSSRHTDVHAEIVASVLAFLGPVVPGMAHQARNLRQHGGYYVRARVRAGAWRRTFERQVVSVAVPVTAAYG